MKQFLTIGDDPYLKRLLFHIGDSRDRSEYLKQLYIEFDFAVDLLINFLNKTCVELISITSHL